LGAFLLTRLLLAWLADNPQHYGGHLTGEPRLYSYWANLIVDDRLVPYADFRIEYPPGALPFMIGPRLAPGIQFRTAFIATMVALDGLGLYALLRMSRRSGSALGPWLWIVLVPLLGPTAYQRLDMVPAVATIWGVERMSARAWFGGGAWLGFAAVSKLYPAALLPASFAAAPRRLRLAAGVALPTLLGVLPFIRSPRSLFSNVVGYHLERGIEVESTWGSALLLARRFGHPTEFTFDFGSFNVTSPLAPLLEVVATIGAVAVVAAGTLLALRVRDLDRSRGLVELLFATSLVLLAVGSVLSPQFVLWPMALGAAAVCWRKTSVRVPALLLAPIAILTQLVFPFHFRGLAEDSTIALVILVGRNLLLIAAGIMALMAARSTLSARDGVLATGPQE
jgi:hypothetical protein